MSRRGATVKRIACLPPPGAPDVLYAVDLPGLVHRHFHGRDPVTTSAGERVEAVIGVVSDLRRIVQEQRPAYLTVAVECPIVTAGEPEGWRPALFSGYKETRRAKPRPPELGAEEALIRAIVDAMRIPVLEAPGYEADDGLAVAAARAAQAGLFAVLITGDKDLGQLVGAGCALWNLHPGKGPAVVGVDEVRARWKVGPELLADLLSLAGDEGDDVPGVAGIGVGKAVSLLRAHRKLSRVLRNAGGIRGAVGEGLRRGLRAAVVSRQLVALHADAPVAWDLREMPIGGFDVPRLAELFQRVGIDTANLRARPKAAVPAEVLAHDAGWDPRPILAARCALEAELEAAIAG
jgi:DNA polymerase I